MSFNFIKIRFKIIIYVMLFSSGYMLYLSIRFFDISLIFIFLLLMSIFCIAVFIRELFWGTYSYKFYIDNRGVKFGKRGQIFELKWEDIKAIGLTRNKYADINKNSFFYFDGRECNENLYRYEELDVKQYNYKYFGVQYRKNIADEIRKYWDEPIQGIYQVEGKGRL